MDFKLIIQGFIVGIGKIIPGISGSMLAMMMGIYEKIIGAVTHFFNNFKENFKVIFNFFLGVLLAIILFSKLILFLLNNYYYETIYLFLGLIIGTMISFIRKLKLNKKNILLFITFFIITIIITLFNKQELFIFKGSLINYLYTCLLGFIDALTSIVPGISGTAIYMMLGSYEYVLSILGNPFSLSFIIYGIGAVLGVVIICYIMDYLLRYKKEETYAVIAAFMIGSLLMLFLKVLGVFKISLIIFFISGILLGAIFQK